MRHLKALFKGKNFVWKIYWNFPLNLRVLPAWSFKIRIKSCLSKRKNFIRNLRAFCIHFLRVIKIRKWGHYFLQVLFIRIWGYFPHAGYTLRFRGKFQYIFQTKFFPLKSAFRCLISVPSFNNSALLLGNSHHTSIVVSSG